MKLRLVIIAALGVALALYLVLRIGWGAVLSSAASLGWRGFVILCLYSLGMFVVLGSAWCVLLPASLGLGLRVFVWARMVRDAAAEVLPFSQLGGMVLGGRAAILHGVERPMAFASMIVDVTTEMFAQLAYVALGIAILSTHAPRGSAAASLTSFFEIGLLLAAMAGGAFLALQRYGHWMTEKLAARLMPRALSATTAVTATIDSIYRSPARVCVSAVVHFAGWIASAVGTWIAFRLIGTNIDVASVIAIESLVYAARSAAFVVPNALGVQEAAYTVLAPLFGVPPGIGLAVSLLKRARDIAVGAPVLLIWQTLEGQRAFATRTGGD
ncbi:MAG TPA: lysylphosphatidylglycerol synthase domain-containing protein [Steroidobacteraceae bacterium]|nr:lysylphosphatidylglycerol synthase domain-containing protein [Steroidobacteraceae bacterium]